MLGASCWSRRVPDGDGVYVKSLVVESAWVEDGDVLEMVVEMARR